MADKNTVMDLLTDEIKDLYSAEKQLTKAIPKMAKGSNDAALQTGKKCVGMEGCISEGAEALGEEGEESILDLGIIGAGTRVEHYEMSGYMTAISLAQRIGKSDVVTLLKASLAEEQAADQKLRSIAAGLLRGAPAEELVKEYTMSNEQNKGGQHEQGKGGQHEQGKK
jgi:ferritin-like metal-binding protein YciE